MAWKRPRVRIPLAPPSQSRISGSWATSGQLVLSVESTERHRDVHDHQPSCPSWCTCTVTEHDDWDTETDGILHLVHDSTIEFSADSLTLRPVGVPAIELQGPDGRIGHLAREQARQLAALLTRAALLVDGLAVEAVE